MLLHVVHSFVYLNDPKSKSLEALILRLHQVLDKLISFSLRRWWTSFWFWIIFNVHLLPAWNVFLELLVFNWFLFCTIKVFIERYSNAEQQYHGSNSSANAWKTKNWLLSAQSFEIGFGSFLSRTLTQLWWNSYPSKTCSSGKALEFQRVQRLSSVVAQAGVTRTTSLESSHHMNTKPACKPFDEFLVSANLFH